MKENNKGLQDLDPKDSLHKEDMWFGGNIDMNIIFLLPQIDARIMRGIGSKEAPKGQKLVGELAQGLVNHCRIRSLK
jgi:hypothetical protein